MKNFKLPDWWCQTCSCHWLLEPSGRNSSMSPGATGSTGRRLEWSAAGTMGSGIEAELELNLDHSIQSEIRWLEKKFNQLKSWNFSINSYQQIERRFCLDHAREIEPIAPQTSSVCDPELLLQSQTWAWLHFVAWCFPSQKWTRRSKWSERPAVHDH